MNKSVLLVLVTTLLIMSCSISLAKYTYVGPYNIVFNDSENPVFGLGFDPLYDYVVDKYENGLELEFELATYQSTFIGNNTTANIIMVESKSDNFYAFDKVINYTSLDELNGFKQLKKEGRIIDGLDGTVGIYKNNSNGHLLQKSVIFCRVIASGYSLDTNAAVIIQAINYTESQFDRLLDTFEFSRLKED